MNYMIFALTALGALAASASPVVSDVTVSQDKSRTVTVNYALSEAAIVTMEAYTNGVSIGYEPLTNATGDVGVKVTAGSGHSISWNPVASWPGRKFDDAIFTVKLTAWALDNPPDYMIVDLRAADGGIRWYPAVEAVPGGITNDTYKTDKLAMRHIRAAGVRWRMGSSCDETVSSTGSKILHYVIMTNDYYYGVYKVTDYQHNAIRGTFSGTTNPRQSISFSAARGSNANYFWPTDRHKVDPTSTCGRLNALTGLQFDLPTEAQWEFACRGGSVDSYLGYKTIGEVAWCAATTDWTVPGATGKKGVQKVGLLKPNGFGLYDVLGDGFEYCLDWRTDDYNGVKLGDVVIEPEGPLTGSAHTIRSGSWDHGVDKSCPSGRPESVVDAGSSYCTYRLACGADLR